MARNTVSDQIATLECREATETALPLTTRSIVETCVLSSMVCNVKSISGTGFFSCTARAMALSILADIDVLLISEGSE
jgi:hypothetical protein